MPPKLEEGTSTERIQIKAPATWVERIDEWRAQRRPIPTRTEAIRTLVDQALGLGDPDADHGQDRNSRAT